MVVAQLVPLLIHRVSLVFVNSLTVKAGAMQGVRMCQDAVVKSGEHSHLAELRTTLKQHVTATPIPRFTNEIRSMKTVHKMKIRKSKVQFTLISMLKRLT
jgi:hypothetical protein